ncbi:hypothetical protein DPMN_008361 [Dreissena polymorpha]|uniref:Uncharacterized protein n=1 Tax=Dreissena polymorpha TaxID=45954 RepID=A0A9D4RZ65_DREPO|nr:hypothetical protein DPMN_008361 [Dreissena polymorpha]
MVLTYSFFSLVGRDIPKHGETVYPLEAYGHGWGKKGDTIVALVRDATKTCMDAMGPNHGQGHCEFLVS